MSNDEPFIPVEEQLRLQARAYKQLLSGSESLLEAGKLIKVEWLG